jgi:hypothetical protein
LDNPAFYSSIIFLILSLISAMLYLKGLDIKGNLNELILNDSNSFNPAKMKAKEYFIKIQENKEDGEMKDTTRELKIDNQTAAENVNKVL